MAISRGEIKKCGFKPIEDHKAEFKSYELLREGRTYKLHHMNELNGRVSITECAWPEKETGPELYLFNGYLPARYELQIILRCLKIA